MLRAARNRYATSARLAAAAAAFAGRAWDAVLVGSLDSWQSNSLASQIAALQILNARGADSYLYDVLLEQNLLTEMEAEVEPAAFAGVAGDGRSLLTLLDEPRIAAKTAIGQGMAPQQAWAQARSSLQTMTVTAVQDAGRAADSVAMIARPAVDGYVRMLNLPSCARCVVLAGKFYKLNDGFLRHPRCDCRHVPSREDIAGDLRTDPVAAIKSGQVTGISRADRQAVDDGANVYQVINAQRGLNTADAYGRRVKATTEATTKRGRFYKGDVAAGRDPRRSPRLRPEAIYRLAQGDRAEALRLLRRFGYLR